MSVIFFIFKVLSCLIFFRLKNRRYGCFRLRCIRRHRHSCSCWNFRNCNLKTCCLMTNLNFYNLILMKFRNFCLQMRMICSWIPMRWMLCLCRGLLTALLLSVS